MEVGLFPATKIDSFRMNSSFSKDRWYSCEIWDFHNGVAEDSSLSGCDVVSLGERILTFQRTVTSTSSTVQEEQPQRIAWLLKMKPPWCFKLSETTHPMTQCFIPEELNPPVLHL